MNFSRYVTRRMFVMRLSYSGRAVHIAYGTQSQEAFLEGRVQGRVLAFQRFGGVLGRVRTEDVPRNIFVVPIAQGAAEGLYRLVDAAYEKRSLAISSNLQPRRVDERMPRPSQPRPSTGFCITPTSVRPPE